MILSLVNYLLVLPNRTNKSSYESKNSKVLTIKFTPRCNQRKYLWLDSILNRPNSKEPVFTGPVAPASTLGTYVENSRVVCPALLLLCSAILSCCDLGTTLKPHKLEPGTQ